MEIGMVNMNRSPHRKTNSPRDHPSGFYSIKECEDGLVDVYLSPDAGAVRVMRGVVPWKEMEDDIRLRYEAWYESAEAIEAVPREDGGKRMINAIHLLWIIPLSAGAGFILAALMEVAR